MELSIYSLIENTASVRSIAISPMSKVTFDIMVEDLCPDSDGICPVFETIKEMSNTSQTFLCFGINDDDDYTQ